MAKQTVNIGSTANDGTGDQLRNAFDKLNQNNDEIYGDNFVTEDMLNDNIVGADELKVTGNGAAGQILTSNADGTFSWTTGVAGDITGVEAGDGLTGGGTGGDVTLNVAAGTGITVTANEVALDTTVQDEITLNTAKVGITTAQAADIVTNNGKVSDQTVTLTEGANVTITGTYPDFTIASDDVVGAVNSVNGDTGVVVLDTLDIAENTNLYYTEARVSANTSVAANTAKTGITAQQASDITANNAKLTDQTVTLTDAGNITIGGTYPDFTIASADVTGAVTSVNGAVGVVVLDTADVAEDTNLYYTEARVAANSAVALNTAKTGITSAQASEIAANTLKVGITTAQAGEIVDNNAKVTNATHTGEVTGDGALTITDGAVVADRLATDAVTTDKIADVNVTAAKLANGAVNHDKLEDRYTEAVSVTTLTGAYSLDWSTGAIFVMSGSLTGNIEFDFTNYKVGQTIDIYNLTGAHSITFDSDAATSETFNKCGGVDYAGASTNLIQVQCVDDSANAVFNYAVSAYVSDTTPS